MCIVKNSRIELYLDNYSNFMSKKPIPEWNKLDHHWAYYLIGIPIVGLFIKFLIHTTAPIFSGEYGYSFKTLLVVIGCGVIVFNLYSWYLKRTDLVHVAKSKPKESGAHVEEDPQTTNYNAPTHGQDNRDRYIGPLKSLELFFKNYSNFSGRSSRSSFLWFQLLDWVVILTVLELVDVMLHNNDLGYYYHPDFGGLLGITWSVVTLVPNISLVVRRLHDTNRSGWWLLLSFTIIGIIPLIVWFCSSGTKGKNIYGPDKEAGL